MTFNLAAVQWTLKGQLQHLIFVFLVWACPLSSSSYFIDAFYVEHPSRTSLKLHVSKLLPSSAQEKRRKLSFSSISISQQRKLKLQKEQRWKRSRHRRQLRVQNDTQKERLDNVEFDPSTMIGITQGPSWMRMDDGWNSSASSFHVDLQTVAMEDAVKSLDAVNAMRERYLASLQKGGNFTSTSVVEPDAACYTTVLNSFLQERKLREAQAVLDQMEDLAAEDIKRRQCVQQTLLTGTKRNGATLEKSSFSPLAPTFLTYIIMAQAWANDYKYDFSGKSAEKAEAILRRVIQVTNDPKQYDGRRKRGSNSWNISSDRANSNNGVVKVWTIVVDGWCKRAGIARRALIRAEELLLEMEQNQVALVRPNVLTYTSFICGLSRCKQNDMARRAEEVLERMKRYDVQPDMVAYTAVINCWAKAVSRRERGMAANRAISLLSEMEHLYINKKIYSAKPSMTTYTTAIAAIGNCLDPMSPLLAEGIVQRMRKFQESGAIANLKPTTVIYNAVIFALGNSPISQRQRSAERAELLLNEMISRAQRGELDVQPDVRTWAFVLRAWTRSKQADAAENAQRLLDRMEDRYRNKSSSIRPNFVCYTTVMGAWGYSRSINALDKMEQILKRMEQSYEETLEPDVRPNTVSYVTVRYSVLMKSSQNPLSFHIVMFCFVTSALMPLLVGMNPMRLREHKPRLIE